MRARIGVLVVGALTALVLAAPSASLERPTTIRVVSSLSSLKPIDRAPKGRANPGDAVVTYSRLHNETRQFGRRKGAVVGSDRATTRLLSDGSHRIFGTATLPGGTIRFDGRISAGSAGTVILSVVGGTGRYENARGTLAVTDLDNRGSALNVYKLVPGGAAVA